MKTVINVTIIIGLIIMVILGLIMLQDWLRSRRKPEVIDSDFEDLRFNWDDIWEGEYSFIGEDIRITLAGDIEAIDQEAKDLFFKLESAYTSLIPTLADRVVQDFLDIKDALVEIDESLVNDIKEACQKGNEHIMDFLILERIQIKDQTISIEYLTAWDIEHTRAMQLDQNLSIINYDLSVAL